MPAPRIRPTPPKKFKLTKRSIMLSQALMLSKSVSQPYRHYYCEFGTFPKNKLLTNAIMIIFWIRSNDLVNCVCVVIELIT
ncbi:unnamed protein product [Nezara viridula]|uniref:Uncharacterized protein n=1 Tax=Nezara viridula TaxID=85310 RepID=A0A9P0MLZ9_NEZVI|nr:unnamed protein product [Nezara viridula]